MDLRAFLWDVYERLYRHFGHREWWPAQGGAFEVVVGAYLTQNVAWANVEKAIANLRAAGLLSPAALRAAPLAAVEACIRPAGFYRQKARRLKAFVDHLYARHGGDLQAMLGQPWPALRAELLSLPGVGPETADSILCYAAGWPVMVVDAYTRRIFHRLGVLPTPDATYDEMQSLFHAHLPPAVWLFNDYHAQIVALGKEYCRKRAPRCGACPLAVVCKKVGVEAP